MKKFIIILFGLSLLLSVFAKSDLKAYATTVGENFTNPVGYDLNKLTFSWKLPLLKNGTAQSAYRIAVASSPDKLPNNPDIWDSGKILSNQSVKVPYKGRDLKSRDKMYWTVKLWNESGDEGDWSNINSFEAGLLNNSDWKGKWLSSTLEGGHKNFVFNRTSLPSGKKADYDYVNPAYIRKEFKTPKKVSHARLYATAKGIYEASVNGKKLSKAHWLPGWTQHTKRLQTDTYDITEFLNPNNNNCVGVILGDGWYSGKLHSKRKDNQKPRFLGQIEIFYTDGTSEIIPTDTSWKLSTGPIRFGDIFDGEDYDANFEMPNWNTPNFKASNWTNPQVEDLNNSVSLDPRRNQPITEMMEIKPVSVKEIKPDVFIFDMGQNMVGWPRLVNIPVSKDNVVKIRFAEILKPDGTLYVDNYRAAISEDTYTPKADGKITYEPSLTFHGFQFVEVSGLKKGTKPTLDNLQGIVLYNDMPLTGDFKCSNEKLNKLQSNIQWGQRGNFLSVPTDCPQRDERLGWTGDAQVFVPTATFNLDVEGFFAKWLYDMNDCQDPRGAYPNVAPFGVKNVASAGWADAGVICPYEMYMAYGNTKIFEDHYDNMKKWIYFLKDKSSKDLIRSGFAFGDWLQPNSEAAKKSGRERGSDCPGNLIGTAYFYRTTLMMEKFAKALGKTEDAKEFSDLAKDIKSAFNAEFVMEDGKIGRKKKFVECQTAYLVPIAFGMLDEKTEKLASKHLVRKIKEDNNHLNTGFIGTPILTSVLAKIGEKDLAYELLEKETYPSWLFPVLQGATTMWERWDAYSKEKGIHPARGNSFNHYAYGAIGKWMYAKVAGIDYDEENPGYKNIIFAPIIGGSLTNASAWHETPYGKVSSSWVKNGTSLEWNIEIPANATGTIIFPTKNLTSIFMNGKAVPKAELKNVPSGKYTIKLKL